jgi:hypothetical protein
MRILKGLGVFGRTVAGADSVILEAALRGFRSGRSCWYE